MSIKTLVCVAATQIGQAQIFDDEESMLQLRNFGSLENHQLSAVSLSSSTEVNCGGPAVPYGEHVKGWRFPGVARGSTNGVPLGTLHYPTSDPWQVPQSEEDCLEACKSWRWPDGKPCRTVSVYKNPHTGKQACTLSKCDLDDLQNSEIDPNCARYEVVTNADDVRSGSPVIKYYKMPPPCEMKCGEHELYAPEVKFGHGAYSDRSTLHQEVFESADGAEACLEACKSYRWEDGKPCRSVEVWQYWGEDYYNCQMSKCDLGDIKSCPGYDIESVTWGANSMWPKLYKVAEPCDADPDPCDQPYVLGSPGVQWPANHYWKKMAIQAGFTGEDVCPENTDRVVDPDECKSLSGISLPWDDGPGREHLKETKGPGRQNIVKIDGPDLPLTLWIGPRCNNHVSRNVGCHINTNGWLIHSNGSACQPRYPQPLGNPYTRPVCKKRC